mmetsp:Transcript_66033/g.107128  ORF Transcript_66033/g.107128 Transcript_66033/m.107128 type:complete len:418 (+) Transcript_66033:600-1853(+)
MMAAGSMHTAGVTKDGTLWSWGDGFYSQLGHGDRKPRERPERLGREMFGRSPAVMVACGGGHTLVLTAAGLVWSCGYGFFDQLGHGDHKDKLRLTLVADKQFRKAHIVMVAAGGCHSVALGAEGQVWTWGFKGHWKKGNGKNHGAAVPMLLAGKALGGASAVLVAAGDGHTVAVSRDGALWAWGRGEEGQLGLGNLTNRLVPMRVGGEQEFGGQVLMAACGDWHTLAVTKAGTLWSWGVGDDGRLGHNDDNNRLVPTQVEAQHFGHAKIVSAAAGNAHSAAVTEHGGLYTWGRGREDDEYENEFPAGLGHGDGETKLVPTRVVPALLQDTRVGRCHGLPPLHALAFVMGNHFRLGRAAQTALAAVDNCRHSGYVSMPRELVQWMVEACGVWPEGRAGELEGVVRLLGGGMMKPRGST